MSPGGPCGLGTRGILSSVLWRVSHSPDVLVLIQETDVLHPEMKYKQKGGSNVVVPSPITLVLI